MVTVIDLGTDCCSNRKLLSYLEYHGSAVPYGANSTLYNCT
jgi:hypothetical protein